MQDGRQSDCAIPHIVWMVCALGVAVAFPAIHVDPVSLAERLSFGCLLVPVHVLLVAVVLLSGAGALSARQKIRQMQKRIAGLQTSESGAFNSACTDGLTGLLNRQAIVRRIDAALLDMWPGLGISVLLIDLDGFKAVNDVYGHDNGDKVLCEVADRLRSSLSFGTYVARLGGDEFAILIPYSLWHRATEEAQAAVDVLREQFSVGAIQVQLAASVGLASAPDHSSDTESLLRAADIAMYHAKKGGGDRVQPFHASMEREICERATLTAELRQAIENNEIVPFYQPIVDLHTGQIVEFEVLARWQHPRHGCLMPSRFIDLVTAAGEATPMLLSLLRQITRDASKWPTEIDFSVNVFPAQMCEPTLINTIAEVVEAGGLSASRLCLEVTEEALVKDITSARATVEEAHRRSMKVALDDFGIGYSSLYQLRELPFDRLKIDRSFLQSIATDQRSQAYVEAMVTFSRSLRLEVVAEGIETKAVARMLAGMRCTFGQGFYYAKPLPAVEVGDFLQSSGIVTHELEFAE